MKKLLVSIIAALIFMQCNLYCAEEFKEPERKDIKFQLLEIKIQGGDTLSRFAERYLNDPARWPELLEYNKIPSGDPNLIISGDMIKVPSDLVKDEIADIFYIKNNVRMRRKEASGWTGAKLYQRLFPEDGVRTAANSYTKIKYLKGGQAAIGENSLVFLRPEKKRDDVVKLEIGEITAKDVKILTASAAIEPDRGSEYTAVVDEKQTTKLSVHKGKVDFISSGELVTVKEGFMSMAEFNKPPEKPIELPDAPEFTENIQSGTREKVRANTINTEFILDKVDNDSKKDAKDAQNIDKIHVQVAQDKKFTRLEIDKVVDKDQSELINEELPDGIHWWRAAFINRYGIKGKFSAPVDFEVNTKPLQIDITCPRDGQKISKPMTDVRGVVEKDSSVTVNDTNAMVDQDGGFFSAVYLQPGRNPIKIRAINFQGKEVTETITVIGDFAGSSDVSEGKASSELVVMEPKDGAVYKKSIVTVRGKYIKGSLVKVNGSNAIVESDGTFITAIGINSGKNQIIVQSQSPAGEDVEKQISVFGKFKDTRQQLRDDKELKIDLKSPVDGEKMKNMIVTVRGKTSKNAMVKVNGTNAMVESDGSFIAAVYIESGPNDIKIEAEGNNGETIQKTISVIGDF